MSRENQLELNDEERTEFLYHVCIEVTMVGVVGRLHCYPEIDGRNTASIHYVFILRL